MTLDRLLRTLIVATFATIALALVSEARAEGGDPADVRAVLVDATAEPADAAAPAEPQQTAAEAKPIQRTPAANIVRGIGDDPARAVLLRPMIAKYASENGIPFSLADAIIRLESRYNPAARNGMNVGLTQINAGTAQALGYTGDVAGLLDAETNLRYGLRYLAQAYKLANGDTCGTILRYQGGHRAQAMTNAARIYCSKVKTIIASAR